MATINYAFKEISCKIVYYGAGLCGKTTNLQYIHSAVPGKFRGDLISLATEQDRTLFFDFLPIDLGEVKGFKTKFQLYTVPGQVYYNATRKLVLRGVDGIVFVVDSQKERTDENLESFQNLKDNLKEYNYDLTTIPYILQYNKRDLPNISDIAELQAMMNADKVPYYESVATTGIGVKETLKAISSLVLKRISTEESALKSTKPPLGVESLINKRQEAEAAAASQSAPEVQKTAEPPQPQERPLPQEPVSKPINIAPFQDSIKTQPGIDSSSDITEIRKKSADVPEPAPAPKPKPVYTVTAREQAPRIAVSVKQQCDVYWRSIKIGSGTVELTNRSNVDNKGDYQITGILKMLFVKRTFWTKLPKYLGKIDMKVGSRDQLSYHHFEIEVQGRDKENQILDIYLEIEDKREMFLEYPGWMGTIKITPMGRKPVF